MQSQAGRVAGAYGAEPIAAGTAKGLTALAWSLHALTVILATWAAAIGMRDEELWRGFGAVAFLLVYVLGILMAARTPPWLHRLWFLLLVLLWAHTLLTNPLGLYLAFPLFFLAMALFTLPLSIVVLATLVATSLLGYQSVHGRLELGAVLGVSIGAFVALGVSLFVRRIVRDAREREALLAELTKTRDALIKAEREAGAFSERERIARDIHDTVSQSVASIVMLLHAAEAALEREADVRTPLLQAREASSRALQDARHLIDELAPPQLRRASIRTALERLAAETRQTSGIDVTATCFGDVDALPTRTEVAILRIAQGAIANVVQHSGATNAEITLRHTTATTLDIRDNGRGFDIGAPAPPQSFGLQSIAERAAEVGASTRIESSSDGTIVRVEFQEAP